MESNLPSQYFLSVSINLFYQRFHMHFIKIRCVHNNMGARKFDSCITEKKLTGLIKPVFFCQVLFIIL